MKIKLSQLLLTLSVIFTLASCFEDKNIKEPIVGDAKAGDAKEEDCDDEAAKKTMEKIKTEEFSLNNTNDAGCTTEEAKAADIPVAPEKK